MVKKKIIIWSTYKDSWTHFIVHHLQFPHRNSNSLSLNLSLQFAIQIRRSIKMVDIVDMCKWLKFPLLRMRIFRWETAGIHMTISKIQSIDELSTNITA